VLSAGRGTSRPICRTSPTPRSAYYGCAAGAQPCSTNLEARAERREGARLPGPRVPARGRGKTKHHGKNGVGVILAGMRLLFRDGSGRSAETMLAFPSCSTGHGGEKAVCPRRPEQGRGRRSQLKERGQRAIVDGHGGTSSRPAKRPARRAASLGAGRGPAASRRARPPTASKALIPRGRGARRAHPTRRRRACSCVVDPDSRRAMKKALLGRRRPWARGALAAVLAGAAWLFPPSLLIFLFGPVAGVRAQRSGIERPGGPGQGTPTSWAAGRAARRTSADVIRRTRRPTYTREAPGLEAEGAARGAGRQGHRKKPSRAGGPRPKGGVRHRKNPKRRAPP